MPRTFMSVGSELNQIERNCISNLALPYSRGKSWRNCYGYFDRIRQGCHNFDDDYGALQLWGYLASWGMIARGSVLQKYCDYTFIRDVVIPIIKDKKCSSLWNVSLDKCLFPRECFFDLVKNLKNMYSFANLQTQKHMDTLITKIILGTFGCFPALDTNFKEGLKTEPSTKTLNNPFYQKNTIPIRDKLIDYIIDFYNENQADFLSTQNAINQQSTVQYPMMEIIDIYFFEMGTR